LAKKYDHLATGARNTLCFGPEGMGPNIMVNITKEVQYVNKTKYSVVSDFQFASKEVCRGVSVTIILILLWTINDYSICVEMLAEFLKVL